MILGLSMKLSQSGETKAASGV